MKIVGIVGTNSSHSTNRQLLSFIKDHFKDLAQIELLEVKDLPLFNKPSEPKLPSVVQELVESIEQADGVIISTPEYNHSIPAVLSNALAWLSYGVYPFLNKPVLITGASYGVLGSSRAQNHLRQILNAPELHASVMPGHELLLGHSLQAFDEDGRLKDPENIQRLENIFSEFLLFIQVTQQLLLAKTQGQEDLQNFSWDR